MTDSGAMRRWMGARIVAPGTKPGNWPCVMRLTFAPGTNGRKLNVRCECMAQTLRPPSPRFTGYDTLGQADSIPGARALWEAHRDKRSQDPSASR